MAPRGTIKRYQAQSGTTKHLDDLCALCVSAVDKLKVAKQG